MKSLVVAVMLVVSSVAHAELPRSRLYVPGQEHIKVLTAPSLTDADPGVTSYLAAKEFERRGRSTARLELGIGVGVYSSFPGSYEDIGPSFLVATPLWLGNRYRFFQWAVDITATLGLGSNTKGAHLDASPRAGCNFYFGGVFGMEFRFGPVALVQLDDEHTVAGLGMVGDGSYVFRLWDDDLRRLKLTVRMRTAVYLAEDDPMNDFPMNAMALAVLGAYEQPF